MAEITFKKETAPARCEICHQADLFDAEQNYCARCDNLPVQQMAQTADAATRVTLSPPNPPGLWRFHGTVSLIPAYFLLLFWWIILTARPFYFPMSRGFFFAIGCYLGGVGLEALIRYFIRSKNGSLPLNINNLIDEWFFLAVGFLFPVGIIYSLLIFVPVFVFNLGLHNLYFVAKYIAISIPLLSMVGSYRVMLGKYRRLSIRAVHVDLKN